MRWGIISARSSVSLGSMSTLGTPWDIVWHVGHALGPTFVHLTSWGVVGGRGGVALCMCDLTEGHCMLKVTIWAGGRCAVPCPYMQPSIVSSACAEFSHRLS